MESRSRRSLVSLLAFAAIGVSSLGAQTESARVADPDPSRFDEAFAEFAEWDSKNFVPRNGIVLVGSSSIVRWNSAESFPGLPIVNRGFGGSQASDIVPRVQQAVVRYDPNVVVYYAGDNDANAGKKAPQIFEDIREFSEAVLAADPTTIVVILSVKPSPSRWQHWGTMQETNALIQRYAESRPTVHYVDVGTPMLGADGQPMRHLFVDDMLHMTPAGYAIWNRVLTPVLAELYRR
jgi:lysophospholipase L1-like esterase